MMMTQENYNPSCKALTKSGTPCRAAATAGGLCFFHANPNKASELGRIGGKSKCSAIPQNVDPLPKLETATAVRDLVGQLIADVYLGKLHPRVASGLAPLMNLQLRAIETADIERRLARLEELSSQADDALRVHRTTQNRDLNHVRVIESLVANEDLDDAQISG